MPGARKPEVTRRLPLGSLRVFVAVAELRSFTLAADSLGVSVSAASMQLRSLEQYLGVQLFRRQGRLVEPTADALQLLPRIRDGLAGLQQAIEEARSARGGGSLYISALPSFIMQWLGPRLIEFESLHPQILLRVEALSLMVDFHTSDHHAAIRFGASGDWPGVHADKLLDEWLVPVCRPDLLKKLGPVRSPDDLTRYRLLHSTTEPWSSWLSGQPGNRWPEAGTGFDDSATVVRLACSGLGLALARWSLIGEELRRGELALASDRITPFARRYYFVCPPKARSIRKLVTFRDWLLAQARAYPRPPSSPAGPKPAALAGDSISSGQGLATK
ncbi:MAG TPA: LysR substrate-binding domain-containing protein [Steroidobacteraceae bacterium]